MESNPTKAVVAFQQSSRANRMNPGWIRKSRARNSFRLVSGKEKARYLAKMAENLLIFVLPGSGWLGGVISLHPSNAQSEGKPRL
jgi:hypothetical protein